MNIQTKDKRYQMQTVVRHSVRFSLLQEGKLNQSTSTKIRNCHKLYAPLNHTPNTHLPSRSTAVFSLYLQKSQSTLVTIERLLIHSKGSVLCVGIGRLARTGLYTVCSDVSGWKTWIRCCNFRNYDKGNVGIYARTWVNIYIFIYLNLLLNLLNKLIMILKET